MKNLFIPIIAFIGISMNLSAQEKSTKELRGDKYTFNYSYDKAINSYSHAKHLSVEGQRKLAEAYHFMDQNVQSDSVYLQLISASNGILPEDYYNYAMVLKINGKYDQAWRMMDKFAELKPSDLRARDYTANKVNLAAMSKDDGQYKIEHLNVNTEAEDFGPSYYKNSIVFASSRATPKFLLKEDNWHRLPYLDIYVSEVDGAQLKAPNNFDRSLNTKFHDGPASFSKDGNFMAFTRNHEHDKSKDRVVELQIFFSSSKDGKWSEPVPFSLNNPDYSVGHPCLTADGNTMYFTSDMPGGYGGADIYKTTREQNGAWTKAENMGDKVNTEGDELFPFFEENSKTLLFASNGRFGLGGLDIFICEMKDPVLVRTYNAGAPLNTKHDDFAIIVNDRMSKGYFSSNRSGDDDIYGVDLFKKDIGKKIQGIAKDNNDNPVPETYVTLLDENNNVMETAFTKGDGAYTFDVDANKNFKLNGKNPSYLEANNIASTFGKEYIVKVDLTLLKKEEIISERVKVETDLGKILELNPIFFDFDKFDIRADAAIELNKVVKVMNENPEMEVVLSSHADCRASKEYNQILSDKRERATAAYIQERITQPNRISGKGYGEAHVSNSCECEGKVVSMCSEEEFQKDRNTEFTIIHKKLSALR